METLTLTKAPAAPATIPELDRPDADQIGDEILLDAAAKARPGRVTSATQRTAESRAWSFGGNVD